MTSTHFVDEDLVQQRREAGKEPRPGAEVEAAAVRPAPLETAAPLTRRKEELNGQVATKLDELERLRARQEALEREKSALEQMRGNQEKYEAGKREMLDRLEECLIALERDEIQFAQRVELLVETQKRFKTMLAELRQINESEWPVDSNGFREALTRSLAMVEAMRKEYHQALARVAAAREPHEARPAPGEGAFEPFKDASAPRAFGEWLKIGLAFSLPLMIALIVLALVLWMRAPAY